MATVDIPSVSTECFEPAPVTVEGAEALSERLEIHDEAYQLCKEYLKGPWESVPKHEFRISLLQGGLSNKLYICRIPDRYGNSGSQCPCIVILRIYGLIIKDFTAQIQESVVFSILAERKLGPKLYAVFPGGRLEEYIPCRALCTDDIQKPIMSRYIAQRLSCYHTMSMPVNKQPTTMMKKLLLYHENLVHVQFEDGRKTKMLRQILRFDIASEINYIRNLVQDTDSPVVFSHNDVQEGNLLYLEEAGRNANPIRMIDFEYSCYNHRGFDIGNHFCEWMYDYSFDEWPHFVYKIENYPTKDQQTNFIKAYIEEHFTASSTTTHDEKWTVAFMIREANRFALLSHLFWALWSVMQAKMSDIGFGYMEYAIARMDAYFKQKLLVE
uniref:choline kinase alpha-like n=1 Tax=Styela clava TaxID=7725 RepID=UPI001939F361|nr:choline kinase alpha-like [Styela clava]